MTTATGSPIKRTHRSTFNAALGILLGVMLGSLVLYSAWGVILPAAVAAVVISGLAITALVALNPGGTR